MRKGQRVLRCGSAGGETALEKLLPWGAFARSPRSRNRTAGGQSVSPRACSLRGEHRGSSGSCRAGSAIGGLSHAGKEALVRCVEGAP